MKKIFILIFLFIFANGCINTDSFKDEKVEIKEDHEKPETNQNQENEITLLEEKDFLTYIVVLAAEDCLENNPLKQSRLFNTSNKVYAANYPFDYLEIFSVKTFKLSNKEFKQTMISEVCGEDIQVYIVEFMLYISYAGSIQATLHEKETLLVFKGSKGLFSCISGTYTLSRPYQVFSSYKRLENNELIKDFTLPIHEFVVSEANIEYYLLEGEGEKWAEAITLSDVFLIDQDTIEYNNESKLFEVASFINVLVVEKSVGIINNIEDDVIELSDAIGEIFYIKVTKDTIFTYGEYDISLDDCMIGSKISVVYSKTSDKIKEGYEIKVSRLNNKDYSFFKYSELVDLYQEPVINGDFYVFSVNKYENLYVHLKEVFIGEDLDLDNSFVIFYEIYLK